MLGLGLDWLFSFLQGKHLIDLIINKIHIDIIALFLYLDFLNLCSEIC